ncbi:uncharacterized protein DUF1543 [Mucilaginibacter yixingensis]|uniref:Uncharacterized protein DUF1543 n=1 Tax=Mucilaginibacter yixingensis TaxID=1295612 RepID=A0A2T5JEA1_9SPHI|nr:DUF1543 domain-containing protein [Mucilaginibacter yixingensis]PTR00097.1 uncharacterized protein DUF1543 [Mucilaginibacter yixingensis]
MNLKLYMVLLGSKAPGRSVEQHDFFFGIGATLAELVPAMREFWSEAGNSLHIDGWREVTHVEGHQVNIIPKAQADPGNTKRLFFINLGGYQTGKLEEQHYTLLTVQEDRKQAIKASTGTDFFKTASIEKVKAAAAHIDEKYGIDVDDIYRIDDLLSPAFKALYHIELLPDPNSVPDEIHLGYLKLNQWNSGLKH